MTSTISSIPIAGDDLIPVAGTTPAAASAPLCVVIDDGPSIRQFLSLILHGLGLDTQAFSDGATMRAAMKARVPDLVFLEIALDSADAIETVVALGQMRFRGSVQLMSQRGAAVLEHVKSIGVQQNLKMLPVLKKPFETDAVVKIVETLRLGTQTSGAARVGLDDAIAKNWIEFWYQPKIDLRRKQLAGAEAYVRARHPQNGVMLPAAFMPGATDAATIALAERAIESALQTGLTFSKLGVNIRISVNIPVGALVKMPIGEIVRAHRPDHDKWAGLVVDIPEEQIINDLPLASELAAKLKPHNVLLAIDDFGRAHASVARFGKLPFAELKLDRALVADCGTNKANAPRCKAAIDLAHNHGRTAVAMGIEKAADAHALVSMGCDFGQGFLLGQPMPEARFISLMRQRATPSPEPAARAS
jgi:EAL domain-containing protein (putative c-di-GMP-specific phosphodiesterase class I)